MKNPASLQPDHHRLVQYVRIATERKRHPRTGKSKGKGEGRDCFFLVLHVLLGLPFATVGLHSMAGDYCDRYLSVAGLGSMIASASGSPTA